MPGYLVWSSRKSSALRIKQRVRTRVWGKEFKIYIINIYKTNIQNKNEF